MEQGIDAVLDDRLDPLAADLLLPVLEGFMPALSAPPVRAFRRSAGCFN